MHVDQASISRIVLLALAHLDAMTDDRIAIGPEDIDALRRYYRLVITDQDLARDYPDAARMLLARPVP